MLVYEARRRVSVGWLPSMIAEELQVATDRERWYGDGNRTAHDLGGGRRDEPVTGQIALPISRNDIADYLSLALETVSRTVSQFNHEGVLALSGDEQIRLRNRERLADFD